MKRQNTKGWLAALCIAASLFCAAAPPEESNEPREAPGETAGVEPAMPEVARRAFTRSCASCHGPDGRGIAAIAPDLRRARKRSLEEWQRYLRDPSGAHPADQGPPLWIDDDELNALADYLNALPAQN